MLIMKFADSTAHEIHASTTVYPSGSATVRSRMEVHMAEDAMTLANFEALMTDAAKTETLRIIETRTDTDENGEAVETLVRDNAYSAYTYVSRVGKERVDVVDHTTGATTSETHLVVVLEQLTYTEQQLTKLGLL